MGYRHMLKHVKKIENPNKLKEGYKYMLNYIKKIENMNKLKKGNDFIKVDNYLFRIKTIEALEFESSYTNGRTYLNIYVKNRRFRYEKTVKEYTKILEEMNILK